MDIVIFSLWDPRIFTCINSHDSLSSFSFIKQTTSHHSHNSNSNYTFRHTSLQKKSTKNKTTSAATTPAQTPFQTPRVSLEESRLVDTTTKQMKQANDTEMLHNLMAKVISGGHNGPYIL
jgi:hypothetical protein